MNISLFLFSLLLPMNSLAKPLIYKRPILYMPGDLDRKNPPSEVDAVIATMVFDTLFEFDSSGI